MAAGLNTQQQVFSTHSTQASSVLAHYPGNDRTALHHLAATDAPTNFPFTDQFNVGVKVFGDATHGNIDKRTYAKAFCREYGKKFKSSVLADTGQLERALTRSTSLFPTKMT